MHATGICDYNNTIIGSKNNLSILKTCKGLISTKLALKTVNLTKNGALMSQSLLVCQLESTSC